MTSILEIRDAIYESLKMIKNSRTEQTYKTNLPNENIHKAFNPSIASLVDDRDYPKACLMTNEGNDLQLPAENIDNTLSFYLVLVTKQISPRGMSAEDQLLTLIEDVKKLCRLQHRLGGLVTNFTMTRFTTDAGENFPEAVGFCELTVSYFTEPLNE